MREPPKEDLTPGRTNGKIYELVCIGCGQFTRHKVVESLGLDASNEDFHAWDDYEISLCLGCSSVSFVRQSRFSEDFEYDPITGKEELVNKIKIYPSRLEGFRKIEKTYSLPSKINQVYNETYNAIAVESWVLSAMGMRTIIELICIDKKIKARNLELKIDKLKTEGVISKEMTDLLHSVRFIGNDAVHTIDMPKRHELKSAWDIINNLLGSIYVVQEAKDFLPNKDSRKNKKSSKK